MTYMYHCLLSCYVMWPGIIWWCNTWSTTAWFYVVMLHIMWPHSHCLILLFLCYICHVIFFLHPLLDLCCNFCASCDFLWPQIVGYRLPNVSLGSDYSLHVFHYIYSLAAVSQSYSLFLAAVWLSFGYGQNKSCINKTLRHIELLYSLWYSFLRKSIFMVIAFSYVHL